MEYYRMMHLGWSDDDPHEAVWDIDIRFGKYPWWELKWGRRVNVVRPFRAYYDETSPGFTDFPLTTNLIHVLSPRFRKLVDSITKDPIQYLPIRIKSNFSRTVLTDYVIANYLKAIRCLDEQRSEFEKWTKDELPFWQKRAWMLGTYRDIRRVVLERTAVAKAQTFLIQGSNVVIFREDVKAIVERVGVTGCEFLRVELS